MRTLSAILFLIFLFIFPFYSPPLKAHSATNVPVGDPVYRDIDKLIAHGLVKDVIYGQRPWSRSEIARIISVAKKNKGDHPHTQKILKRLSREYHQELENNGGINITPLEKGHFNFTLLDSPSNRLITNNSLGNINALINPMVAYQAGRHFVDGSNLSLETIHRAEVSQYFSIYAQPRFEILVPNTGSSKTSLLAQNLYGKLGYKNLDLQVGRDSLVWGQGENGGIILSNNARPLDMVKISTPSPFYMPWILKYMGPTSFQFFVAEMGAERVLPHSILSGYKLSFKPVTFFELGLNHVVFMGGDGAVNPSFWGAISDFSGVLNAFQNNKGGSPTFTNRIFSLEGRWILPFLRNSSLYAEIGFDDTNKEIETLLEDNAIYYFGFYAPRLDDSGKTDLTIEYKHVSAVSYRHGQFRSGYTLNQKLLGDELGPDGDSISLQLRTDLSDILILHSKFAYERRDSDQFTSILSGGDVIDINKTQNNPAEHRYRLKNGLEWKFKQGVLLKSSLGYERVKNFGFNTGATLNNFMGSLSITIFPSARSNNP